MTRCTERDIIKIVKIRKENYETKKYLPLQLLNQFSEKYPGIWEIIEDMRSKAGKRIPQWSDWCYVPMECCMAIAMSMCPCDNAAYVAQQICALSAWRQSKEVYVLDPDMEDLLCGQTDLSIPTECLLHLPYHCFYIDFQSRLAGYGYVGVFVHLSDDRESKEKELRFLYVKEDCNTMGQAIDLTARDLTESVKKISEPVVKMLSDSPLASKSTFVKEIEVALSQITNMLKDTLQAVLYICAQNAEVTERKEHPVKRGQIIRDRYAEIRKWDVGMRIGAAIRIHKENERTQAGSKSDNGNSHASPRPHMRKGHWHHFWIGARQSEERRLILKWLPPTFVGVAEEEMPIVLHKN